MRLPLRPSPSRAGLLGPGCSRGDAMIEVEGVSKSFGKTAALVGVDMIVPPTCPGGGDRLTVLRARC